MELQKVVVGILEKDNLFLGIFPNKIIRLFTYTI